MAIRSFRHDGLKEIFEDGRSRAIAPNLHKKLARMLDLIDGADSPADLYGVHHFHALSANLAGRYSMHVSRNYRLTFAWDDGPAGIDFEDYH